MGNEGRLPEGIDGAVPLTSADVARQSPYGWPVKAGTLTMTFTVPGTMLDGAGTGAMYYLVRYDGTCYQLVNAELAGSGPSATFQASPTDDSGTFYATSTSHYKMIGL